MAENSKIEWTDHTFNPWIGCTKVSPGCANCYAEELMDHRYGKVKWGKGQPRQRTTPANWKKVEKWNREAAELRQCAGDEGQGMISDHRPRVFVASLADWLDPEVPIEWLADLLDLIRRCPNLDFLLLTKRPELWRDRIAAVIKSRLDRGLIRDDLGSWLAYWVGGIVRANVWIGTTVEDQKRADERIPALLRIPAKIRFLSCEPLLGPVDLRQAHMTREPLPNWPDPTKVDWVICGGESGSNSRHFDPDWARSLRDQCREKHVAFFMKQMGGKRKPFPPIPDDLLIRQFP